MRRLQRCNFSWDRLKNSSLLILLLLSASAIALHVLSVSVGSSSFTQLASDGMEQAVLCPKPILAINKEDNPPDNVKPGAVLTYTITYSNVGNADATEVIVTDTLDNNVTFKGSWPVSPTGGAENVKYWKIDNLLIGSHGYITATVTVSISADSGMVLTNLVKIDSPDAEMASSTETTTVAAGNRGLYLPIVTNCWDIPPCEDPHEPNNALCSAHPISASTCITSHICSSNDRDDYYYIIVKVPSTITMTLADFVADYDLYLYDSTKTRIPECDANYDGNGKPEKGVCEVAEGVYYIRVNTVWHIKPVVPGSYKLCVTF